MTHRSAISSGPLGEPVRGGVFKPPRENTRARVCMWIVVSDPRVSGSVGLDTVEALARQAARVIEVRVLDGAQVDCEGALRQAAEGGSDAFVLVRDDVVLGPDALLRLKDFELQVREYVATPLIVVGRTAHAQASMHPRDDAPAAAGDALGDHHRWLPSDAQSECSTLEHGVLWINAPAIRRLLRGGVGSDPLTGGGALAWRARQLGIPVWMAPGVYGVGGAESSRGAACTEQASRQASHGDPDRG